jgi:hypothetical protein
MLSAMKAMKAALVSLSRRTYLAIAMLGLSGSLVVAFLPRSFAGGDRPSLTVYLLAGLTGLAVTAAALAYAGRFEPRLKRRLLWLAFSYNALIVLVKMAFAPFGLYTLNAGTTFASTFLTDQNQPIYYAIAAGIVFLIYALALTLIYRAYLHRFNRRAVNTPDASPAKLAGDSPKPKVPYTIQGFLILIVAGVAVYATGLWALPVIFGLSMLDYLVLIFTSPLIAPILGALLAGLLIAIRAFSSAEKEAASVQDSTVLASMFWLGLTLIAVYHVMWLVFMIALVSVWPFNTYTPK